MTARKSNLARKSAEGEIVLERVFDAPRDLVFRTFTEADRLVHWWGPKGFTTPACKVDLHVGGVFH